MEDFCSFREIFNGVELRSNPLDAEIFDAAFVNKQVLGFFSVEFSMKHVNVIGHQGRHFHITILLNALEFIICIHHPELGVRPPNHKPFNPCACMILSCLLCNGCTNMFLQYANEPGGLCEKWHHRYLLVLLCGGLLGCCSLCPKTHRSYIQLDIACL